jgi:ATPase subunit of ABC transporter with duplicated ATPase domains
MGNYIETATFNIPPGSLAGTMEFKRGLNLLSGENGTFKTKLLQALKGGATLAYHESPEQSTPRIQAISPKRNAQRRAFQQIYTESRRNDTKLEGVLNARSIDDATFEAYPSLGELFYVVYNDFCRDGGNQADKMNDAAADFNRVIGRIFDQYKLQANWDTVFGAPQISLLKHAITQVPLEGLSLGEQEILSLATYINSSRNTFDIFLIDEPEVHLNWHIEEKLFDFLDDFCEENDKQMIVVTHSRVVFTQRFLPKTTFLFWEDGRVKWGPELTGEQRRRLAGDAIEIIRLGAFTKPAFFVEDDCHALVLEEVPWSS